MCIYLSGDGPADLLGLLLGDVVADLPGDVLALLLGDGLAHLPGDVGALLARYVVAHWSTNLQDKNVNI